MRKPDRAVKMRDMSRRLERLAVGMPKCRCLFSRAIRCGAPVRHSRPGIQSWLSTVQELCTPVGTPDRWHKPVTSSRQHSSLHSSLLAHSLGGHSMLGLGSTGLHRCCWTVALKCRWTWNQAPEPLTPVEHPQRGRACEVT